MQKAVSQATQQLQDLRRIQEKEKEFKQDFKTTTEPLNNKLKIKSEKELTRGEQGLFVNTKIHSIHSVRSNISPYSTELRLVIYFINFTVGTSLVSLQRLQALTPKSIKILPIFL